MYFGRFLLVHRRWLGAGLLLNLTSCFGQTFFISLFSQEIRDAFGLSHGGFGLLFMLATLASAASILWAGQLVDTRPVRVVVLGAILVAAAAAAMLSVVRSLPLFFVVLFLLRFCGHGMLDHTAGVIMARWYDLNRGRALSIASLGHAVGEAILPLAAVALVGLTGWRIAWLVVAGVLLLGAGPVLFRLLRTAPPPEEVAPQKKSRARPIERTRSQVMRDPLFYAVLFGVQSHSLITTGDFFHQVQIVTLKGWSIAWFAANYPLYAGVTVGASLVVGVLVDRFSARALLPLGLVPLAASTLALGLLSSALAVPVFMVLVGIASGFVGPVTGALWAEIYGREHLGAIRAMTMASSVLASALAPGLMGLFFDWGVTVHSQMLWMAAYCALAMLLLTGLGPALNRMAAAGPG